MKILLADDSQYESAVLTLQLQQMGHEVVLVGNGQQAIDADARVEPARVEPDIILMDVIMPQMDGYIAVCWLRITERMLAWIRILNFKLKVDIKLCRFDNRLI